jgi:hypothetical protein
MKDILEEINLASSTPHPTSFDTSTGIDVGNILTGLYKDIQKLSIGGEEGVASTSQSNAK